MLGLLTVSLHRTSEQAVIEPRMGKRGLRAQLWVRRPCLAGCAHSRFAVHSRDRALRARGGIGKAGKLYFRNVNLCAGRLLQRARRRRVHPLQEIPTFQQAGGGRAPRRAWCRAPRAPRIARPIGGGRGGFAHDGEGELPGRGDRAGPNVIRGRVRGVLRRRREDGSANLGRRLRQPFRPPTSCFRQLNPPSRRPTLVWLGAEGVPSTLARPACGTGARREWTGEERGLVSSCGAGLYSGVLLCMYPRILRTIHGATASILFPLCLLRERRLRPAAGFSLSEAARRGHTLVPRSVTPRTFRRPPSGASDEPVETFVQPTEADLGPVTPGPSTIPRIPPRLSIAPRGIFSRPLFSVAFCARHPPTHPLTARCSASRQRAPRGGQWG